VHEARAAIEAVFRAEAGRVLASLIAVLRDFDHAEDAFQEAMAAALVHWPSAGIPVRPAAWLITTARRKALDRLRHEMMREHKQQELQVLAELERAAAEDPEHEIPDDRLRLIFTCCHPALSQEARVALTLRTLGGLTTAEIAHAFLVPEPTLARRLVRAKQKIREAAIPYRVPTASALPQRLDSVLAVVYLVFNEGYGASAGESPLRRDLSTDAIHLARLLAALLPDEPEALGLLALLLLHDARRDARLAADGTFVPLDEQDRSRWDRGAIAEGLALLRRATAMRRPGPYQTQAAISAAHAESASSDATDWRTIAWLYGELERMQPSPVVSLNRAVAVARASGPEAGLAVLEKRRLGHLLADYQPYHCARADLLRRSGRRRDAAGAYRRAIALARTDAERAYLERRLAEVDPAYVSSGPRARHPA
jgi:RNA polymerase sigma-70 factor (ECF subfamily)